ncbi:MAG TPA: ATP-binding protein [Elusimicrobiota bacterium]|nr:ATP-binding protein [Elusimicrobiota bacterium]
MRKAIVSWSSGKDSAFALGEVLRGGEHSVAELFTTVNETYARVAMHGSREELLDAQAAALRLPLAKIRLPWPCPNAVYESRLDDYLRRKKAEGVTHVVFGDLFLEDIRRYRDEALAKLGLTPVYPLWGRDTRKLAEAMIDAGQKAVLVCVDPSRVPKSLAGREFDRALLAELPAGADPCGENGEFHSFVYGSPLFADGGLIPVRRGETVERSGFVYADLLPAG